MRPYFQLHFGKQIVELENIEDARMISDNLECKWELYQIFQNAMNGKEIDEKNLEEPEILYAKVQIERGYSTFIVARRLCVGRDKLLRIIKKYDSVHAD